MRRGAQHDLAQLRILLPSYDLRGGVIKRAAEFVLEDRPKTIRAMKAVMQSLTPSDFFRCHQELYGGRPVWCDDYAKIDRYGLWFIKFDISEEGNLVVRSCHESDDDEVELHNGTILRKPRQ